MISKSRFDKAIEDISVDLSWDTYPGSLYLPYRMSSYPGVHGETTQSDPLKIERGARDAPVAFAPTYLIFPGHVPEM